MALVPPDVVLSTDRVEVPTLWKNQYKIEIRHKCCFWKINKVGSCTLFCSEVIGISSRPRRDSKIAEILHICEYSDYGMEDDDDRIVDLDYQADNAIEQEPFSNDENEDDEVNIDEIIGSLEDSEPDPSPSTSAVLTGWQAAQTEGRPKKPQTLNLRWKKKICS
ncbi:hypothetical protein HHI36_019626 [Cryptolaemus montrouzieri]|uniref:Uncharacterized protein n=1 Tax=Cryptolaemus montrouzieri TaxID=559131 RepID=A0ABD2N7W7_9CUCU